MKQHMFKIVSSSLFLLSFFLVVNSQAQTAGNFTFTINPVAHNGKYGAKHVVAMWLENSSGAFVKTKLRQSSGGTIDHLATWTSKSASNVVDATTGATLTSYTAITVKWDGSNVAKAIVADGDYKIWIEMAWDDSKTTAKTVTSFTFTKGVSLIHLTPANTTLFTGIVLDWVPTSTSVEDISQSRIVNVFPNPTSGIVNLEFKSEMGDCHIQVVDSKGSVVYFEHVAKGTSGIKKFDLGKYSNGLYLVNILFPNKKEDLHYKVVLKK